MVSGEIDCVPRMTEGCASGSFLPAPVRTPIFSTISSVGQRPRSPTICTK